MRSFLHHTAQDISSCWPLRKLENWLFLGTKMWTAAAQTIVWLVAKGLWELGQSLILGGFTLSQSWSAPCGTGQTTIDTGCSPALLCNCVDHLAQGSPNFFVRGPHKVIQTMSRAGRLTQCDRCGICYILPNQQIFRKYIVYYFLSLTKWLRGLDEMASRAASGPRAVVWRPLI